MATNLKSKEEQSFLTFSLNKEEFAIPLLKVCEVIAKPEKITPIPQSPKHFVGIINLKGKIISIINLKEKLEIKNNVFSLPNAAVIVLELNNKSFGILIDQVNEVVSTRYYTQSPKPEITSIQNTDYISSILRKDNRILLELDVCQALDSTDESLINKSA